MVATEEIVKEILSRGLDGFKPVFYVEPETRRVLIMPPNAGLLVVPVSVFIYVAEDVDKVDEEFLRKIEELTKLETMERLTFSFHNDWDHMFEKVFENDLNIAGTYGLSDGTTRLFLDLINLDNKEETENYMKVLLNLNEEKNVELYYTGVLEEGGERETLLIKSFITKKSGKIDELLKEREEELKNLAFQYPEEFAVVKKAVDKKATV